MTLTHALPVDALTVALTTVGQAGSTTIEPTANTLGAAFAAWTWLNCSLYLWFSRDIAYPPEVPVFFSLVGISLTLMTTGVDTWPNFAALPLSASALATVTALLGVFWIRRGFRRVRFRRGVSVVADGGDTESDDDASDDHDSGDSDPTNEP